MLSAERSISSFLTLAWLYNVIFLSGTLSTIESDALYDTGLSSVSLERGTAIVSITWYVLSTGIVSVMDRSESGRIVSVAGLTGTVSSGLVKVLRNSGGR